VSKTLLQKICSLKGNRTKLFGQDLGNREKYSMQPQNLPVPIPTDMFIRNHTKHFSGKDRLSTWTSDFLWEYKSTHLNSSLVFLWGEMRHASRLLYLVANTRHNHGTWTAACVRCCFRFTQWQKPTITDGLFFYRLCSLSVGHLNKNLLQPISSVTPLDIIKCCTRQLRNLANVHAGNTKLSTSLIRCYGSIAASHGGKR